MSEVLMTVEKLVEAIKVELRELVADGTIPASVPDYGTLHEYVDANMLGGIDEWLDEAIPEYSEGEGWDEAMVLIGKAHDQVNAWIKSGALLA